LNADDGEDRKRPTTFDFVSVWATATLCHFGFMAGASCIAGVLPGWLQSAMEWALTIFAKTAEKLLRKFTNYSGESRYFWTIYFLNSLLYGLMFALVWRHFRERGRRRGFPIERGS